MYLGTQRLPLLSSFPTAGTPCHYNGLEAPAAFLPFVLCGLCYTQILSPESKQPVFLLPSEHLALKVGVPRTWHPQLVPSKRCAPGHPQECSLKLNNLNTEQRLRSPQEILSKAAPPGVFQVRSSPFVSLPPEDHCSGSLMPEFS